MAKDSSLNSILSILGVVGAGVAAYQGFRAAEDRSNQFRAQQEAAARQYSLAQQATENQTRLVNESTTRASKNFISSSVERYA